ncbi:L-rhamnose isomerase [Clostridia bacterium]|nr:L-rhamnose isomerase [Clostridia bacterium]
MKIDRDIIQKSYENAKRVYALYGVDTDKAIEAAKRVRISLHCWQGDDVTGFEGKSVANQNVVTGNYPGRARNGNELRADIEKAFSFSPLAHKVNIHSFYAETKTGRGRNNYTAEDFKGWIDWAKEREYGLDFNTSFFAHPMMNDGMSLASPDKKTRDFWVEAGKAGREIAAEMGKAVGQVCVNDIWIPDGLKDNPIDRARFRGYLTESLDRILEKKLDRKQTVEVLEGKLFGIGTECFVVGSHEYYMLYAAQKGVGLCMDTGHYLPTETVTDKLSVVTQYIRDVLLHVSRGVRWDSDHVVVFDDMLTSLFIEAKRLNVLEKIYIGLDYFDASINRIGAWTVGLRATGKALVAALVEPTALLKKAEEAGNYTERLALSEEFKSLPFTAVWDQYCAAAGVPVGGEWIEDLRKYEADVTGKRK